MRKLLWFTVGFTAACAVSAYLVDGIWLLLLSVLCFLLLIFAALLLQGRKNSVLLVLFGCIVGLIWAWCFDAFYLTEAKDYDSQKIETTIEITDYSEPTDYGITADGKITLNGREYPIRVYSYVLRSLSPGDRVWGDIKLQYTNHSERTNYFSSIGIPLVGYLEEDAVVSSLETVPAKYFVTELRQKILNILDAAFPLDTMGLARALLLGDDSYLTYEQETQLSVSGIRHIVAVSGLHISILFSMVYAVVGYRRIITPVIGLPLLLLFAALAGFTPSVTRACIMQALMILALMFDREYDPPTALAFAVLTMLAVNPMTVTSVGFQLSVSCVVGILLFSEKIRTYLLQEKRLGTGKGRSLKARLARWTASSISISLSTMIVTMPLCAIYFGTVSLISILTNLLTLWVVPFLLLGIVAICIFGAVWLPLGKAIAWVVSWPMRYVLLTAEVLSELPFAAVYTESIYIVLWLILCYVLLTIFWFSKKKQPLLLLACITIGLCVSVAASWIEPRQDNYRMTVLDVGQGQCILLQAEGKHYMIDCGGYGEGAVADLSAQTLLSQGITKLDGLILTHYDADHAGGVDEFLTRIPAKTLYLPAVEDAGTVKETLIELYSENICWVAPQETVPLNAGTIRLFAGEAKKSDNESGLCILCRIENCDILITGDRGISGERALLRQTALPDLEVLVAGHHGSAYSTGDELLTVTTPEVAIISVGAYNSYGHPAKEVLNRLNDIGCQVLRTDQNGTIIIRG